MIKRREGMQGKIDMEEHKFAGAGVKFPIEIDKASGRFAMATEEESVRESLYIILMTQKGERWIHPEFGSRMLSYTFMDTSLTRINMMTRELEKTILDLEPRITEAEVRAELHLEQGYLLIHIYYRIGRTDIRDDMAVPFYLYGGTEGEKDGSPQKL